MSKQFKQLFRNLLWLGGLAGLAVVVIWMLRTIGPPQTAQAPEPTPVPLSADMPTPASPAHLFDSPLATPTAGLPMPEIIPSPLPPLTLTRPPSPPTRTSTPTSTPAPPTPTPEPLPTLIPDLETLVYATRGEKYPELYRGQIDKTGRFVGSPYLVSTADLWGPRIYVHELYPAPDGKQVAVDWAYGDAGEFVSILNVADGQFTRLLAQNKELDTRIAFIDWAPDGNRVLVTGFADNLDLGNRLWLIDVQTHHYSQVDTRGVPMTVHFEDAAFSPDGKAIAYAYQLCPECGSEVWLIPLDATEPQRLFAVPEKTRIPQVLWSPDGRYIASIQRGEGKEETKGFPIAGKDMTTAIGELWVFDVERGERRLLSSVLTGSYQYFRLAWTPDSRQIVFVSTEAGQSIEQIEKLVSNIYKVEVENGQVTQLTDFTNALVLRPIWSPDGSGIIFFGTDPDGPAQQFAAKIMAADGRDLHPLNEEAPLVLDVNAYLIYQSMVWLPASLSGGTK